LTIGFPYKVYHSYGIETIFLIIK